MINIYLDIDGVLLTRGRKPADFVQEFLEYVLSQFPDSIYWLTTHCRGDAEMVIRHLAPLFETETVALMKKIKATNWDLAKTEGIDFSQPFLWFDDNCFDFEEDILRKHGVFDNWIEVNLEKDKNQLLRYVNDFPLVTTVLPEVGLR